MTQRVVCFAAPKSLISFEVYLPVFIYLYRIAHDCDTIVLTHQCLHQGFEARLKCKGRRIPLQPHHITQLQRHQKLGSSRTSSHEKDRNIKIVTGDEAVPGACETLFGHRCIQTTMFRNPVSRLVSAFTWCGFASQKVADIPPLCGNRSFVQRVVNLMPATVGYDADQVSFGAETSTLSDGVNATAISLSKPFHYFAKVRNQLWLDTVFKHNDLTLLFRRDGRDTE